MSPQTARALLLVVAALLLAGIWGARGRLEDPYRKTWAAGVVILGLSLLIDIAPEVGGPASILVAMGFYWANRNDFKGVAGAGKNPATSSTTGLPSSPTTTRGGTTSSGSTNPSRPTAPPGYTPVGGPR